MRLCNRPVVGLDTEDTGRGHRSVFSVQLVGDGRRAYLRRRPGEQVGPFRRRVFDELRSWPASDLWSVNAAYDAANLGLISEGVSAHRTARGYTARVGCPAAPRVHWQLLFRHTPEPPVGDAPVLVVGSLDDRIVPRRSLEWVARRYGGAPLLFPGMGHDLMLDARWQEPIDAIVYRLSVGRARRTDSGNGSSIFTIASLGFLASRKRPRIDGA